MTKPTKKELRAALTPLREEAERQGMKWLDGGKPMLAPIMWRGHKIRCMLIRRAKAVCGVPFPYHAMQLSYELIGPDGQTIVQDYGVQPFIDRLFVAQARGTVTIGEAA